MEQKLTKTDASKIDITSADQWRQVLSQIIPIAYRLYIRRGLNPSLAEELVQKTVFDAVRGLAGFDPAKGTLKDWILAISRNNLALELRQRKTRPAFSSDLTEYLAMIDTQLLPDEVLEKQETAHMVRKALGELKTKESDVLKAKYIEDLPARLIAEKMDISEKAVHDLLYRARNSLRQKLRSLAPLKGSSNNKRQIL